MKIVIPSNVLTTMAILIPIVMFDVLERLKVMDMFFPDSERDAD